MSYGKGGGDGDHVDGKGKWGGGKGGGGGGGGGGGRGEVNAPAANSIVPPGAAAGGPALAKAVQDLQEVIGSGLRYEQMIALLQRAHFDIQWAAHLYFEDVEQGRVAPPPSPPRPLAPPVLLNVVVRPEQIAELTEVRAPPPANLFCAGCSDPVTDGHDAQILGKSLDAEQSTKLLQQSNNHVGMAANLYYQVRGHILFETRIIRFCAPGLMTKCVTHDSPPVRARRQSFDAAQQDLKKRGLPTGEAGPIRKRAASGTGASPRPDPSVLGSADGDVEVVAEKVDPCLLVLPHARCNCPKFKCGPTSSLIRHCDNILGLARMCCI